jgi:two-component system sensor histidine kinase/response regulator
LLTAKERRWLDEHKPFYIAVMDGWPPFNYVDEYGDPNGIGIDYLNALNKRLGNILEPVPGEWKRIYKDVKDKRLDAIMDITPKPAREPFFNFTTPYLKVPHIIIARKDSLFIESEKSLEGRTLALEQGFGNVKYFQENYPGTKLKLYTNTLLALDAVSRGDADAYAGNRAVALYLIDKYFISNLQAHGRLTKAASALSLGIRKDWPIFRDILQRALDDIGKDEHREIINRWIRPDVGKSKQPTDISLTVEELEWLSEHREIPIGVDGNWPPIDFFDESGEHVGVTADYLNLLNARIGIKFIPQRSPRFKDMLQKVEGGELKVGVSISFKKERAEKLYFSKSFYQVNKVIIAREGSEGFKRIEDLYGKRVAIEDGFLTMHELQEKHPQIELIPVASTLEALQTVSLGSADAYMGDQVVADWLQRQHGLSNLQIVGNPGLASSPLNFVVSKTAPEWETLINIINKVLISVTEEERQQIEKRWLEKDDTKRVLPRIELTADEQRWLQEHKSIRLGVDANWAPVEFIDQNGNYRGLTSEYMAIFAEQLGINWIKPNRMPWTEVLSGLEEKHIDVAPLISRTQEREAYLNFTKTYLDFPYVIFNRQGDPVLKGLDGLIGKKVAAVEGYSINNILKLQHPQIEHIYFSSVKDAMRSVSVGETDAYVGSLTVGGYLIGQEGLTNLQVASPTRYSRKYGIGIRKDWPELVGILNKAIDSLDDALKNDILRRWSTVKYKQHVDYTLVWQVLGIALLVLLIGSIWTVQIRRNKQIAQKAWVRLELTLRSAQLGAWEARISADGVPILSLDEIFYRHHGIPDSMQDLSLDDFFNFVDEGSLPAMRKNINRFLKGSVEDFIFEYRVRGQERWLYSKGHTLEWDELGHPKYIVGITQDMTERHKAHEALKQANRFKGEFLANMSHEIRTPMNAIIGLGHLLTKTSLLPKQRDYVHKMQTSAQSLLGIIDDILDFSKIEAGRLTIESVPFSLDDIFENLSIMVTTRIGDSPIEFLYDISSNIPQKLVGDPYRIGQILNNLVSNAVKFTEQGSIVVRVLEKEKYNNTMWLRCEVEDTGIGVSQENTELLFDPFSQANGSTTRQYGGTGLGLSICQKLCTLMGGSIGVKSELNKGSLFYFELPLHYSDSYISPKPHPELRNLNVLLVDDNLMAQTVLSEMLESMTFQVTIAGSGNEALLRLNDPSKDFDFVLLDWRMPGIDGSETARQIYNTFGEKRPAVILMTAYGREVMEQTIRSEHFDGLLVKPLTPSLLFDAIITAFESRTSEETPLTTDTEKKTIAPLHGTILLVEDNKINQQVAKELLEQMGVNVDTAENGEKAVSYVKHHRPDLVLMDIQMPTMDGYEATRHIRKIPAMEDLPIFAMTANALVGDAEKSLQSGMNGHISKPVNPEELYNILSEQLPRSTQKQIPVTDKKTDNGWIIPQQNLPGVNLNHGLKQVGGNTKLYLKLLRDFVSHHGNSVNKIQELIASSRFKEACRTAHTLKGVGGNIGAYELQQVAAEIEACLNKGMSPSEEMIKQFSMACDSLFNTLHSILPTPENNDVGSGEPNQFNKDIEEDLKSLISALKKGNAHSVKLYNNLRPVLVNKLEAEQINKLDKLINQYDFEEADEFFCEVLGR